MTHRMTWILVVALFLIGGLQPAIAEQILLKQSDGTTTPWGGVGEKGSVTCDNCSGGGGSGGPVQTLTIASGVTSNSVGATVAGVVGAKSFYGEVVGTGAVTATISLYCARVASATPTAATAVLLGTITLSGTTQHQDMTPVSTAACKNIFPVFTSITGTGATVLVEAWY